MKKTQLAAAIALAVSGAMIAPQASAGDHKGMQAQINALSGMMKSMQKELKRVKSAGGSQSLQEWENTVNAVKVLKQKKNRVSFRGGFARNDNSRIGDILTDANWDGSGGGINIGGLGVNTADLTGNNPNGDRDGWYFGAALDHHINSDLFGISDLIGVPMEVLAEIMFEYKEFDRANLNRAPLPTAANDSVNAIIQNGGMDSLEVIEKNSRYEYESLSKGVDENFPLDFHSPYGCSKGAADQYVRDYHRIYNLNTVVLRQSCIYGTQQYGVEDQGWVAWITIASILDKQITIYGDGMQIRDILKSLSIDRERPVKIQRLLIFVLELSFGNPESVNPAFHRIL